MIGCNFNGRLGNNLFQIATVISLAKKLNVDFILPERTHAGHRGDLPVDLSMFKYNFNRGTFNAEVEYHEEVFEYREIEVIDKLRVGGFFQSWKYFEDVKDQLLTNYFTPSDKILESLNRYEISPNSVGVSVRRGDYLMLQNNHCVLGTAYYQTVFDKYFQDNTDQVFIFSDDLDWCRSVFGSNVIYVEDTVGVQLFLMSKMKNLILSNSTFAWWGAYLNQNNGIIVAPDPWFGPNYDNKNTADLYCKNWRKESHIRTHHAFKLTQNMFN